MYSLLLVFPILMFWKLWRVEMELGDPKKEEDEIQSAEEGDQGFKVQLNFRQRQLRYIGLISESFNESQVSLKIQIGYYLAFCYIIGLPGLENTECMAREFLSGQNRDTTNFFLSLNSL